MTQKAPLFFTTHLGMLPPQKLLLELIRYEPETGCFYWRKRKRDFFKSNRSFNTWNTRFGEKKALTFVNPNGYLRGSILGKLYMAHRIAWVYCHGQAPKGEIDHINGNPSDNRIKNLRDVTKEQNAQNTKIHSNNTSGYSGVSYATRERNWRVEIGVHGKQVHLGSFKDKGLAIKARAAAEKKLGYHQNHGRLI